MCSIENTSMRNTVFTVRCYVPDRTAHDTPGAHVWWHRLMSASASVALLCHSVNLPGAHHCRFSPHWWLKCHEYISFNPPHAPCATLLFLSRPGSVEVSVRPNVYRSCFTSASRKRFRKDHPKGQAVRHSSKANHAQKYTSTLKQETWVFGEHLLKFGGGRCTEEMT